MYTSVDVSDADAQSGAKLGYIGEKRLFPLFLIHQLGDEVGAEISADGDLAIGRTALVDLVDQANKPVGPLSRHVSVPLAAVIPMLVTLAQSTFLRAQF